MRSCGLNVCCTSHPRAIAPSCGAPSIRPTVSSFAFLRISRYLRPRGRRRNVGHLRGSPLAREGLSAYGIGQTMRSGCAHRLLWWEAVVQSIFIAVGVFFAYFGAAVGVFTVCLQSHLRNKLSHYQRFSLRHSAAIESRLNPGTNANNHCCCLS